MTDHLTINGSGTYTDARLENRYCKDPGNCKGNGNAGVGQMLPITPLFKGNAEARYDFNVDEFTAHLQAALTYQTSSWADLRTVERGILGMMPSYTVANFAAGFGKDNWQAELTLDNAFDERAQLYRYSQCTATVCGPETYIIPNRPRTISLHFSQSF